MLSGELRLLFIQSIYKLRWPDALDKAQKQTNQLFRHLDANLDGRISFREFVDGACSDSANGIVEHLLMNPFDTE